MSFKNEECEVFVIDWPDMRNKEKWIKTLYRDTDGMIYIPAAPANMEKFLLSYMQANNIDFVLSDDNHIYMNISDMAELFPDRLEVIHEAKLLVEKLKPFKREKVQIH